MEFWHTEITLGFGSANTSMSLAHIINDIFMCLFFLLVGLEIKYEMTVGELTNIRQAILPVGAAIGGVAVPIIFYVAFNQGSPETLGGWGVPVSYTHLDVYKRQVSGLVSPLTSWSMEELAPNRMTDASSFSTAAVSYTHLDVYKRQVYEYSTRTESFS